MGLNEAESRRLLPDLKVRVNNMPQLNRFQPTPTPQYLAYY